MEHNPVDPFCREGTINLHLKTHDLEHFRYTGSLILKLKENVVTFSYLSFDKFLP